MGARISQFFKKKEPPKSRIVGIMPRLKNLAKNNYRGIVGVLPPLCILSWQPEKGEHKFTVALMWMWMFWFYLIQPVAGPVVGLIPIFVLPMAGAMSSDLTCACFMNDNVVLFITGGMLLLLLNNSGIDRRIGLWFICSGDACQYSGKRLVLKCCTAAFFLSMFSNRLITTSTLTQYVYTAFTKLQATVPKGGGTEPNFITMRNVICNAIHTSSAIGSTAIIHATYSTVLFRAIFSETPLKDYEYPDIFNYLQFSAFAFPVAFVMFIFNFCYHMLLINWTSGGKSMSNTTMTELRTIFKRLKAEIPRRVSLHEKLTVLFLILLLAMLFFRWNQWIDGWAEFRKHPMSDQIPEVKDATITSIFLILLHIIPKGYGFLKFLDAEKKSQLPPLKPESAILWWRFVDKNINYGYFFSFGSSIALIKAARHTGLDIEIAENLGLNITEKGWNAGLFIVILIETILANLMTAVAACGIFLPLVMCMSFDAPMPWPIKVYCAAMGVGIAASFGFCLPHQYTPAYFCHTIGKVPIKKMAKYSFIPVVMCLIILWLALIIWAPFLFDPEAEGVVPLPTGETTPPPPPAP